MRLQIEIPDEELARSIAANLLSRRDGRALLDDVLRRIGPALDAAVLNAALPLVERATRTSVSQIVEVRARRMMGKDQPLKTAVDEAVRKRVEQLRIGGGL
jgi:hypothetical protein